MTPHASWNRLAYCLAALFVSACAASTDDTLTDTTSTGDSGEPPPPFDVPYVITVTRLDFGTGGMAVNPDGSLLIGDFGTSWSQAPSRSSVHRVTADGEVSEYAGGIVGGSGNALLDDGTLLQSSYYEGHVYRIDTDGGVVRWTSGTTPVPGADHLVPTDDGGAYVTSCFTDSVMRIEADGSASSFATSPDFSCPGGMVRSSDGNLYVASFENKNIVRVTPSGETSLFTTLPGPAFATGYLAWANDRLYVAVHSTHEIVSVGLDGVVRVEAGNGNVGRLDGPAAESELRYPVSLAASAEGDILYFTTMGAAADGFDVTAPTHVRKLVLR